MSRACSSSATNTITSHGSQRRLLAWWAANWNRMRPLPDFDSVAHLSSTRSLPGAIPRLDRGAPRSNLTISCSCNGRSGPTTSGRRLHAFPLIRKRTGEQENTSFTQLLNNCLRGRDDVVPAVAPKWAALAARLSAALDEVVRSLQKGDRCRIKSSNRPFCRNTYTNRESYYSALTSAHNTDPSHRPNPNCGPCPRHSLGN